MIFLEDECILSTTPKSINVSSYHYLNPFAVRPLHFKGISQYLARRSVRLSEHRWYLVLYNRWRMLLRRRMRRLFRYDST